MSVPKEKLDKLFEELEQLDEKDMQQAVIVMEDFIKSRKNIKHKKPSDYIGALKHMDVDIDKECREMRNEWEGRGWESST